MYIILLGPPGSGKGTQGEILAKRLDINHISTGDLFREILGNPDHPLYSEVQVVKDGKLVSDEVVNKVVESGVKKEENQTGILFDGYPRTVAQAEALDQMLERLDKKVDLIIDFDATREVLLHRLLGRRVCPQCKKVYHERQGFGSCPDCDVELIQRDDDNEQTIMKRFEEYREKTAPLQEYYKNSDAGYISIKIDDIDKTPKEVQEDIISQMSKRGVL